MAVLPEDHDPWPLRALLLALLGAAVALATYHLWRDASGLMTENPLRLAAGSLLVVGGIVFAFTLERQRSRWSALFALACGAIVAGMLHWNGSPGGWESGGEWRVVSALLAVAIAAPLFQTSRDAGRRSFDYQPVHAHAWTNIVLWFAAWAFVVICFLLVQLLAELFHLIGLDQLRTLVRKEWFIPVLVGTALGGGIGLLRDRDKVLFQLQRVVTAVLSILVPLLAIGLVAFVAALPFTGLQPLWDQTSATTPILLSCVIGAVILVNAAIGTSPDEEASSRPVRWGAAALAATALPLAVVAVISTAKRIAQHGYTPDRLWALVFVLLAAAVGAVYLFCLIKGRGRWPEVLRPANIRIAIGICLVALVLATPLTGFGAISTRNQLARLESGKVSAEEFDWAALRFDFGPAGRAALERLHRSTDADIRQFAEEALRGKTRWDLELKTRKHVQGPDRIIVRPIAAELPEDLKNAVLDHCVDDTSLPSSGPGECLLFWTQGATSAVVVRDGCAKSTMGREGQARPGARCSISVTPLALRNRNWVDPQDGGVFAAAPTMSAAEEERRLKAERQAIDQGKIEIRTVERRQVFVGDQPVSAVFE